VEPNIGAVTLVLLQGTIVAEPTVEVVVLPEVGHRGDAPAQVIDSFLKAALVRQVWIAIAQGPFAEVGRALAASRANLRHRGNASPDEGPSGTDRTRTTVQGIEASHELAAGRSTHGGDVEVGKANALAVELIEVRRLQHRIAVAGQIAIALVIGEKDDD